MGISVIAKAIAKPQEMLATIFVTPSKVAKIVISGKASHLKIGEMILMPAKEPHALKAVKRFKMILIMIRS